MLAVVNNSNNTVSYNVLKTVPEAVITTQYIGADVVQFYSYYTDPDNAILGKTDLELYETSAFYRFKVGDSEINQQNDLYIFQSLTEEQLYEAEVYAYNYDLGNGNIPEKILNSKQIETTIYIDVTLDDILLSNIHTSDVSVRRAFFSGTGLSNIASGYASYVVTTPYQ